jgi:hypothetical protein
MTETVETAQGHCRMALVHDDITPPVGIYHRMWGAAEHDQAEGVHRPLRLTVLASESLAGDGRQILLALDHCIMRATELDPLVAAAADAAGIDTAAVTVTFSHTHAAGLMGADRVAMPGGELIPPYLESVRETAHSTVTRAIAELADVRLVYGQGSCSLARQRDYWDADSQQHVCGFNPAGECDDTLVTVSLHADDGSCLGTIVNYGCHPTTLSWDNRLISPDFPGAMRELVEQQTAAPCLFLQAVCGDTGPRDGFTGDTEVADRNGRQLGHAALAVLTGLPPAGTSQQYQGPVISGATIGCWQHVPISDERASQVERWDRQQWTLPLAYRSELESAADVQQRLDNLLADEQAARAAGSPDEAQRCRAMAERDQRLLARLNELPAGSDFPYQLTCWRIGDGVWLFLPGEPYQQLQQQLRFQFAGRPLVIVSNCGAWGPSYLVPEQDYGKGIYQESVAVLAAGCLEQLSDNLAAQLEVWLD